jgi:hypothetical protein
MVVGWALYLNKSSTIKPFYFMASTSETGHSKNISTFEDLIGYCTGYGATYNPAKATLKLPALTALLASASTTLQAVKVAKSTYNNATNAREIVFKPLKPLATKVISALAASDVVRQTVDDAKSVNMKIQGKRAVAVKKPGKDTDTLIAEPVKTASTSQQSFDKMIDHFAQLIQTLTLEAKYIPNENELKVATLNTLLADLKAKNTAVVTTTTNLSNSRIARDKVLYAEITGLCAIAMDVKTYLKSVFGATSPQYKQVSGLSFKTIKGD